jgi:hypothetical protein
MSSLRRLLNLGSAWLRFRSRAKRHPATVDPAVQAEIDEAESVRRAEAPQAHEPRRPETTAAPVEEEPAPAPLARDVTEAVVMDGDRAVLKRL